MPAAPLTIAAMLAATTVVGALVLALAPDPFAPDAAALVAGGLVFLALVTISGTLLVRGRWTRAMLAITATAWLAIGAVLSSVAGFAPVVLGAATLTAAAGPWLSRWLRHRPAADGAPPAAVVALLGLVATPAALGMTLADGVVAAGWGFAAWSAALAFAIARAWTGALTAGRFAHPAIAAVAAWWVPGPARAAVLTSAVITTAAMWRREVAVALAPVVPVAGSAVRFPPEITPPSILEAAGLDETGRPR